MAKTTDDKDTAVTQETPQEATQAPGGTNTPEPHATPQGGQRGGPQKGKTPAESVYSAKDLTNAARSRFGVPPEVVGVALKLAGKKKATYSETQELVKAFMERKVSR